MPTYSEIKGFRNITSEMSVGNKISQSAYRPDITVWVEIGNINVIGVTGS